MAINNSLATLPRRTWIEHGAFPLSKLASLAVREGRRPRAIYTAHKWFARRLGTVFRALLIGAVSPPKNDFWQACYGKADLRGLTVLDPFVGLRPLHTFRAPNGTNFQVLHHFWVQVVTCYECGGEFDAHPNFQLAYDLNRQWVFCSHCGQIEIRRANHETFKCGACGDRTTIMAGHVDFGRAICPHCTHSEPLIEVGRRTGCAPRWREFAVEVLSETDGGRTVPMENRLFFFE